MVGNLSVLISRRTKKSTSLLKTKLKEIQKQNRKNVKSEEIKMKAYNQMIKLKSNSIFIRDWQETGEIG